VETRIVEPALPAFTAEESARLTQIWDRLYALYLERVNCDRPAMEIEREIEALIQERNKIRAWGWSTGRDWKDDIPDEVLDKLLRE
jgi:hypothetical protein